MSLSKEGYRSSLFVDKVSQKYVCTLCDKVLRNPRQSTCGHRFCSGCLTEFLKFPNSKCPEDNTTITLEECFADNFARREINLLMVVCDNKGCQWRGQLGKFDEHLRQCTFAIIACSHCKVEVPRQDLDNHLANECLQRQVKCEFCAILVLAENYDKHLEQECSENGARSTKHSSSLKACPYGCGETVQENQLEQHLKDVGVHLCKLTSRISTVEDLIFTSEAVKLGEDNRSNSQPDLFPLQAAVANDGVSESSANSKPRNRSSLPAEVTKEGLKSTQVLTWDSEEKFSSLEQRLESLEQKTTELQVTGKSYGEYVPKAKFEALQRRFEQLDSRQSQLELEKKRQDDALRQFNTVLPDFDLRISILESTSYDGTLVWKISEFRRRYDDAMNGKTHSLYSQPFFTSRYGYKMCLRLYPYGDGMGKGKCISLFFVVMQGEYDDILDWPFQRKISFTLLNPSQGKNITDSFLPDPQSSSFRKPKSVMNIASGCPLFAPLDRVWNEGFVKNDCIYVRTAVSSL